MNLWLYTGWVAVRLVAWWVAFAGVGGLVLRSLGCRAHRAETLRLQPWLGWVATLAVLQLWHFFLPIDRRAVVLVLGLAALGWWLGPRPEVSVFRLRHGLLGALVGLGLALWIAGHTTTQARVYDSGLYHIPAVRWAATYRVVPGLGNLHGRLAFNNSYFLYAALLHAAHPDGRYHHLASGVLLFTALLSASVAAFRVVSSHESPCLSDLFETALLAPLIVFTVGESSSSPTPDLAASLLGMRLGSELLRALSARAVQNPSDASPAWHAAALLTLAAAAVTVKLTVAAFAGLTALMTMPSLLRCRYDPAPSRRRAKIWTAGFAGGVLGAWIARGVILSGYPLYPWPWGGLPVEWRVPQERVERERDWVRSWARMPGREPREVLGQLGWLRPWLYRMAQHRFSVVVPLGITALLVPGLRSIAKGTPRAPAPWRWLTVPLGAILFWFITAPEPRLSASVFWILASGSLALVLHGVHRVLSISVLAAVLIPLICHSVDAREFLCPWQRDAGPLRVAPVEWKTTASGLGVYVPVRGDQCWDAPLPCTPYFNPQLRLRKPDDLASGFVMDAGPEDGS